MKKYLAIAKITFANIAEYRSNLLINNLRFFILLLTLYSVWLAVFSQGRSYFGYEKAQILTYVLLAGLLRPITLDSRTDNIAGEISQEGKLFAYLLRPVGYFRYWLTVDWVYKIIGIIFATINVSLLLVIFRTPFVINLSASLILFLLSGLLASVIYFLISILVSSMAFWTYEVWGIRFALTLFLEFSAGAFFPLSVLPPAFAQILSLLPFPYLVYWPAQIYLGKATSFEIIMVFAMMFFWLAVLSVLVNFVWQRGLRVYTAEGA